MSVKYKIRYEAEDTKGNLYSGHVKAKTFKKALKYAEVLLEQVHGLKVCSSIKLEVL